MPINPYDLDASYATVTSAFVAEAAKTLSSSLARIEHCLNQLSDEEVWWRPREEMNAIGNLVLHLCGNVEQWVNAPLENRPARRDRPAEFATRERLAKVDLLASLSTAVNLAAALIGAADTDDQLLSARRIQGFNTNVLAAAFHAVTHFEGHTQEIVSLTRQIRGNEYKWLWTPTTREQGSTS